MANHHNLTYVGRATGVSPDGSELLVESNVQELMAKIESFPDNRRQHVSNFISKPEPAPLTSPSWLLDSPDAEAASFEQMREMEVEPTVPMPECERRRRAAS